MCGIAGILRIHDPSDGPPPHPLEAIPEAWLDVLDESIKHRGPDGQGRFRDRAIRDDGTVMDVAFVHRRMSIIDHEGGRQPMVHDGKRLRPDLTYARGETPRLAHELCPASEHPELIAVVFNGCIYNHLELREELEAQGHVFETDHSDTEVLVHGWRHLTQHIHQDADGMMALATWNRSSGRVMLTRDEFGEKPLAFGRLAETQDTEFFSSVQGIGERLAGKAMEPHFRAWIQRGFDDVMSPSGRTLFVPAASQRWLGGFGGEPPGSAKPIADTDLSSAFRGPDDVDKELRMAVRTRLEADVPVACFLSGGIDSSLIAASAIAESGSLTTLCVRMPDARYDESGVAAEVSEILGTDHETVDAEVDPAQDLVGLIEQIGLPFGDSSLLPTYWVSKAARERVKVALSGDGGDELFLGYERYRASGWIQRWRPLLSLIPPVLPSRDPKSTWSKLGRLTRAARGSGYVDLVHLFDSQDLRSLLGSSQPPHSIDTNANRGPRFARNWDISHYLPGDLLRKSDTASMSVALEVRSPFLCRRFARRALATPNDVLMPGGQRKGLLKQVARKYLPDHIVDRPKQGFAIPVGEWFRSDFGGMRTLLYDHLESADPFPGLGEAGVEINMAFVRRMLREHDAAGERSLNPWHGRDHSQRLYMLLVLSIWAKWLQRVRSG